MSHRVWFLLLFASFMAPALATLWWEHSKIMAAIETHRVCIAAHAVAECRELRP